VRRVSPSETRHADPIDGGDGFGLGLTQTGSQVPAAKPPRRSWRNVRSSSMRFMIDSPFSSLGSAFDEIAIERALPDQWIDLAPTQRLCGLCSR